MILSVYLHNHLAPYENYGLALDQVNLKVTATIHR